MLTMDARNPHDDIEELWSIEAERRWQEIEAGIAKTVPWEEVRARLKLGAGQVEETEVVEGSAISASPREPSPSRRRANRS
jgi:Putative addiction module component